MGTPHAGAGHALPQLHAGYHLGWLGNIEGYYAGAPQEYQDRGERWEGLLYLHGIWVAQPDRMVHGRTTRAYQDYAAARFTARRVSLDMSSESEAPFRVRVMLDGKPVEASVGGDDIYVDKDGHTYAYVDEPRTYSLVRLAKSGPHDLTLSSNSPAFALSLFTFDQ